MKKRRLIQFIAAFFIIVFSLSTVIGFACSVGINMGFNNPHHHDEEGMEAVVPFHTHGQNYMHDTAKDNDESGNCCHDKVVKLNEADKSSSHSFNAGIKPIFVATFLASFYDINISYTSHTKATIKYFVRNYHPPIQDIRTQIQSFQI